MIQLINTISVDVKSNIYIGSSKKSSNKDPKFKVGDIFRISKYKNIFAKGYTPDCSEEGFVVNKLKILCCGHMLLMILMEKELLEHSTKNNRKKQIKKNVELKNQSKEKAVNYMLNGKGTINHSIAGQIKKTKYK